MTQRLSWSQRMTLWQNRWHARRATRARPDTGFLTQPEPRNIGRITKGQQLATGTLLLGGHLVELGDQTPWGIDAPSPHFTEILHSFGWLDDLAALGNHAARDTAQAWTYDWIARYGKGRGPGWTPALTGRRVIGWINHAVLIRAEQTEENGAAFDLSLAQQTLFLAKRWKVAPMGLARFEALSGLIYAGLTLTGMEAHVDTAADGLAVACKMLVDEDGGVPSRNPEDLLEIFTLLNWTALTLSESGRMARPDHAAAIERIAPALRALRHSDGGLARFHGGGRGNDGRLDQALATSGVRPMAKTGLVMGYARIHGGRTSVIVDAAPPPTGEAAYEAHASTLAFEVTTGRRPLVVNCGSGAEFGADWQKAGRATPSHSVLGLDGMSSSRLVGEGENLRLESGSDDVLAKWVSDDGMTGVISGHDGYLATHGLGYVRRIEMSKDGRLIYGEETLAAASDEDMILFDAALTRERGVPLSVRFHLHPDVDASLDLGGTAASLALKSGEIWVLRYEGRFRLHIEPSVYLEKGRLKPRPTKQVVLSGTAIDYSTRIRWSLAKAQDTPVGLRDLVMDDPFGATDDT